MKDDMNTQRSYLYLQLRNMLRHTKFALVLPLHQASIANVGYCHGFGEHWQSLLLNSHALYSFSWDALLRNGNYNLAEFDLTEEIINAQRQQSLRHYQRTYTESAEQQAEFISQKIFASTALDQHYIFSIARKPYDFMLAKYCLVYSWHQLRLYRDKAGYMHMFDANCGWFKSTQNNLTQLELRNFLVKIFKIMHYDKKYNIIAYTLPVKKLTFAANLVSCRSTFNL